MIKIKDLEFTQNEIFDYLKITDKLKPALANLFQRKVAADNAKKMGMEVTDQELQGAFDSFRAAHGLNKAEDTEAWIKSKGVTLEALENHIETSIIIEHLKDKLEKEITMDALLSHDDTKNMVREMAFQIWLNGNM
ncbi:hypothetical protein MTBBW1_1680055 [Desulfamplus magnetovallimortis]|uniref:Uncharacterized protein n=1 Tax=Desulfamplus magnetovallimortis TaxID=1246637 RepID=A0A1W1H9L3_9BACT|nr:hypothetical protein [Desulfamplus magnetovallimortis]SLM29143.1 hypothetical protein MTBBW1_1680055 [Desulfamplus magnetovallimortis]